MFKYSKSVLPCVFDKYFNRNSDVHNYNTRCNFDLHIPKYKLNVTYKSVKIQGVHIWNHIHKIINVQSSMSAFKKHLKCYLLKN